LEDIESISIGSIIVIDEDNEENENQKNKNQLDSYQELDLFRLKNQWNNLILKREKYLKKEIMELNDKNNSDDDFDDIERENYLLLAWIELIEERNAISLNTIKGIPGALTDSLNCFSTNSIMMMKLNDDFEKHCPILFLDKKGF
jgi:hypothetical protein